MRYATYPRPVLGPCACQDCGEPLYWARRNTTVLNVVVGSLRWRDWTGRIHKCTPGRQRRYNGPVPASRRRGKSQIAHETIHHLARVRAGARETWDNGRVGSSDESNTIADDARVLATTHDAGVIAPIEVVAR